MLKMHIIANLILILPFIQISFCDSVVNIIEDVCENKREVCEKNYTDSCASQNRYNMTRLLDNLNPDPEFNIDRQARGKTAMLLRSRGYECEQYFTVTKDGYNLSMWRIMETPQPNFIQNDKMKRPALLMMHGLLGASHDFLLNPRRDNLPMMLADDGYDVFLGNNRGTSYSNQHTTLSNQSVKYWEFSWHQFGIYDLTAMIDEILKITSQKKLFYIGFSQGTTQFLVAMAKYAEYNKKVHFAQLLAPVAYLGNSKNKLVKLLTKKTAGIPLLNDIFAMINGAIASFPKGKMQNLYYACQNIIAGSEYCASIMLALGGCNYCELNCTRIPVYASKDPENTAYRNLYHYAQLMASGRFCEFDESSIKKGRTAPKDYYWKNITVKISLYSGKKDALTVREDVKLIVANLTNVGALYNHLELDYDHLDFLWGLSSRVKLFEPILLELRKFQIDQFNK